MGGSILESKLVAAFKFFDLSGDGTINRDDLTEICKQLEPEKWNEEKVNAMLKALDKGQTGFIDYSEFAVWITSGVHGAPQVMTIFDAAVAKMPGQRLADGDNTDASLNKIRTYLKSALDVSPAEYASPKVTTNLTWLREIADLLDPIQNPSGFRLCQGAVVEHGGINTLLGLSQKAQSDGVVIKCLEVLARTAFGNMEAAAEVVSSEEFLPTIHVVLTKGKQPAKLTALQLAQAIAASSTGPQVQEVLPKLLSEVVPLLSDKSFEVLPQATFDVLVSISFSAPAAIVESVPWPEVASWLSDSRETGRPSWLGHDNLTVLASGLLAANILALPISASASEHELEARQQMQRHLVNSSFLEFFVLAMEAAVSQQEWPAYSGAFHSVSRLTPVVSTLSGVGFRRQLVGVVAPLAKIVEFNPHERTTKMAILGLRGLVDDLSCLEEFLTLGQFRSEVLEVLHKDGDEPEATDLASCTTAAENVLASAQSTFEQSKGELKNPPSVKFLAELFNEQCAMDGELTRSQILQILPKVPVGPVADVDASLSANSNCSFGFAAFAEHIYGTPTLLGWWPSLMEDVSCMWSDPAFQELQPPLLMELLSHYELGAKGTSGVTSDIILHEVLPQWGQTVEGELVEDLFAEIRGDEPLDFEEFATWMCRYFQAVKEQEKQMMEAE